MPALETPNGSVPLLEFRLRLAGREWSVLHTEPILTHADEQRYLNERDTRPPYGVALWPAAIALAHEIGARADTMRGASVLELGAGTGLPGIVAASFGARVAQTDRNELVLSVCRMNGARNAVAGVDYRLADWADWHDAARYDWILGADVLYSDAAHSHLRQIFETNLAPGGRVLLADPFRAVSLRLLESLEGDGWRVSLAKWSVGETRRPRAIGLFELTPP